jgi:hypothetical protein
MGETGGGVKPPDKCGSGVRGPERQPCASLGSRKRLSLFLSLSHSGQPAPSNEKQLIVRTANDREFPPTRKDGSGIDAPAPQPRNRETSVTVSECLESRVHVVVARSVAEKGQAPRTAVGSQRKLTRRSRYPFLACTRDVLNYFSCATRSTMRRVQLWRTENTDTTTGGFPPSFAESPHRFPIVQPTVRGWSARGAWRGAVPRPPS